MVSANGVANGHGKHTVKPFMDTPWVHMCYTHTHKQQTCAQDSWGHSGPQLLDPLVTHSNSKLMFLIPGDTLGPKFWTPWAHKCYTRSNSKLDYLGHSGPRLLGIPCYRVSSDFCDRGEELLILGSLCMRTLLLFLHTLYTDSMADRGELVLFRSQPMYRQKKYKFSDI